LVSGIRQGEGVFTDPSLTTCPEAAEQYRHGLERLLAGDPTGATGAFSGAVRHDPGFALGHAALAAGLPDGPAAEAAIARARECPRRLTRRERQQVSIVELALAGRLARASVLGREHLNEFPDDRLIHHVLAQCCDGADDLVDR
jgi:hypothetical protein